MRFFSRWETGWVDGSSKFNREFLVMHKQNAAALFCIGVLIGGFGFEKAFESGRKVIGNSYRERG